MLYIFLIFQKGFAFPYKKTDINFFILLKRNKHIILKTIIILMIFTIVNVINIIYMQYCINVFKPTLNFRDIFDLVNALTARNYLSDSIKLVSNSIFDLSLFSYLFNVYKSENIA